MKEQFQPGWARRSQVWDVLTSQRWGNRIQRWNGLSQETLRIHKAEIMVTGLRLGLSQWSQPAPRTSDQDRCQSSPCTLQQWRRKHECLNVVMEEVDIALPRIKWTGKTRSRRKGKAKSWGARKHLQLRHPPRGSGESCSYVKVPLIFSIWLRNP